MRTYHTEPTTPTRFTPAECAVTWAAVVPAVVDVTTVERGTGVTGIAWLRDLCC